MDKIIVLNACLNCKHLLWKRSCAAFPKGIPDKIWIGDDSHRKPYPGDNGIQFEALDDSQD